ncbi:unnamed protein product [Closterium sp. Yama58-4]|nr:unnamed protein product [Closterium sp. Yama58-4]
MASVGTSSMGNGKAVRALLAIVAVIAGTLRHSRRSLAPRALMRIPPSQAAATISVSVQIAMPMLINGRAFSFSPRRCVNLPAMSPSLKARVVVPWQQASMSGKAACRLIRFFQASDCKGQSLDVFANGQQSCAFHSRSPCFHHARMLLMPLVRPSTWPTIVALVAPFPCVCSEKYISGAANSALCVIDNLCQYAICPAGANVCTPPTDNSAAVTCTCNNGYSVVNNKCQPPKASCVTTGCPSNKECVKRTGGSEMECRCKSGYNAVGGTCVPAAKSGTTTAPSGTTSAPSGTASAPSGTTSAPSGTTSVPSGTTSAPSGTTTASSTTTPSSGTSESSSDISDSFSDVTGPSNYVSEIPPSYISESSTNASESSNDVSEFPVYTSEFPN